MYSIGPYEFTETDAKRTVMFGNEIFDLYAQGRKAEVIEHLRPAPRTGELETDLNAVWSAGQKLVRKGITAGLDNNAVGFYANTDAAGEFQTPVAFRETPLCAPQSTAWDVHVFGVDADDVEDTVGVKYTNVMVV